MTTRDWADSDAAKIIAQVLESGEKAQDAVAARLRLIKQIGIGDGIALCGAAVDKVFAAVKIGPKT